MAEEKNGAPAKSQVFMWALGALFALAVSLAAASFADVKTRVEKVEEKGADAQIEAADTKRDIREMKAAMEAEKKERKADRKVLRAIAKKLRIEIEEEE